MKEFFAKDQNLCFELSSSKRFLKQKEKKPLIHKTPTIMDQNKRPILLSYEHRLFHYGEWISIIQTKLLTYDEKVLTNLFLVRGPWCSARGGAVSSTAIPSHQLCKGGRGETILFLECTRESGKKSPLCH